MCVCVCVVGTDKARVMQEARMFNKPDVEPAECIKVHSLN